jgi:ribosome biogenesis GTPase
MNALIPQTTSPPQSGDFHDPSELIWRVANVDRDRFLITNGKATIPAELTGKFLYEAQGSEDFPCVGDQVEIQLFNEETEGLIHRLLPRKTFLKRLAPGGIGRDQLIAANVDFAFILQACDEDFNPKRLDRYLVMAGEGKVTPVVLLTKVDLVDEATLTQLEQTVQEQTLAPLLSISIKEQRGLDTLFSFLVRDRVGCLLGSSGVGKTTLLNYLLQEERFATGALSASGEGKHTTTRRQWIGLPNGAFLIDTPGMRELGIGAAEEGLILSFEKIQDLSSGCRFTDCRHEQEPGCQVRDAVSSGKLSQERYESFLKLQRESQHHQRTLVERRERDRAFGKMVRTVKKQKMKFKD